MQETGSYRAISRDDEIDLIELVMALWSYKLMIILITCLGVAIASAYSLLVTPTYSAQAIIAPASINRFGTLAGALSSRQLRQEQSAISSGVHLANEMFDVLVTNLNSRIMRRDFDAANPDYREVVFKLTRGKQLTDPVSLSATDKIATRTNEFIVAYSAYVSHATVGQLNEYLKGMGVTEDVEPSALYRLEQPATTPLVPIKPRPVLIISLGFVLGAMFGVFAALVRHLARLRSFGGGRQ
ncbi:Wzz/FepE/Etk N-terminal domain-containing protein [Stutzerimonas stutzeri]|uniref:Wzz/FepE/Etk N-terminal domain-containing protein n=1 Tax=Stutzerimonas sp. S1 TaxID=3030652 RepID=UPI00222449BF|nr:Wzz/FepE/Etk N-terminal domain-containing protein [Stutzerimonas sp. S1]MCW3150382.1 Wzz/FepE/Etk N-terminal domain-containing protein [Stutzerimonas sp. S1]